MRFPETVRTLLAKRYQAQCQMWLIQQGQWPLNLALGCPSEKQALQQLDALRAWLAAWRTWQGPGEINWCERQWRNLGTVPLPKRLVLHAADEVAAWLGETHRWQQAKTRYQQLTARWPTLHPHLAKHYAMLADYSSQDFHYLENVLAWLQANPNSALYPRQLPIAGIDSKWLETRSALLTELITVMQADNPNTSDFFARCGLKRLPQLLRLRLLDPQLQRHVSGLSDITAPVEEIAKLDLPISKAYIIENLQTGLAFTELPGAVVVMGLGYHVDLLAHLTWLKQINCYYWGDIDTHGFAILSRARCYLPNLQSILMDEQTLLAHRTLWGVETKQCPATELPLLTAAEQCVYQGLKHHRWQVNLRLEQERIAWDYACKLFY